MGRPRAPPEVKNHDFHWRVVQNRGSTFSRPGAPGTRFGGQKVAKTEPKTDQELTEKHVRKQRAQTVLAGGPGRSREVRRRSRIWKSAAVACPGRAKLENGVYGVFRACEFGTPCTQRVGRIYGIRLCRRPPLTFCSRHSDYVDSWDI